MLNGAGTEISPLLSRYVECMDINLMNHVEKDEKGIVMIIRDIETDELYAISFSLENFAELLEKGNDCL